MSGGDAAPPNAGPPSVVMHEGNGGEYRKSFHGFPRGTAQLVSSPASFIMQPMQIDTWNRVRFSSLRAWRTLLFCPAAQ